MKPTLEQVQACLDVLAAALHDELSGSPRNPQGIRKAVAEVARMRIALERSHGLEAELLPQPVRRHRGKYYRQVA